MASKVISGEAAGGAQPMPWHTMDGTTPLARRSPQSSTRDGGNDQAPETGTQLAQRRAAEAEKNRQVAEARCGESTPTRAPRCGESTPTRAPRRAPNRH